MAPSSKSFLLALAFAFVSAACSSAQKKTTPELSKLHGKRVALVEVAAEPTARKVVEVALVNQLIQSGAFILISKQDLEAARTQHDLDPRDWKAIAERAGADYALRAKVLQFDADVHQGFSEEEVDDSQMAQERGEAERKVKRLYKVKSLTGAVRVQLDFTGVKDEEKDHTRSAVAEAKDKVIEEAKTSAIHLPPKMRFLENLSNKAFRDFFERYN